jgi:DNA repair exonuclease SbcCD ATPase subunit
VIGSRQICNQLSPERESLDRNENDFQIHLISSVRSRNERREDRSSMWRSSLNECRRSLIFVRNCRLSCQSEIALGNEMKRLNEKKHFEKVLSLFDTYRQDHAKALPSLIITQALKASTHIGDLQRGIAIDQLLSSGKHEDSYISASLIHLYSKSINSVVKFTRHLQCNVVRSNVPNLCSSQQRRKHCQCTER